MAYETVGRPGPGASASPSGQVAETRHDPWAFGQVPSDMEAIFGAQVLHPPVDQTAAQAPEALPDTTRSRPRVRTILGALVVAIAAGALFAFMLDGPSPGSPPQRAAPGPRTPPAPRVIVSAPAPTAADMVTGQAPAIDDSPASPVQAAAVSPTPVPRETQQQPARVALRPALVSRARDPVKRAAPATDCAGGSDYEQAHCGHEAMMTADQHLRRAYAQARRAGVPSEVLANYNYRWADLLQSAEAPPLAVAAGYRDLAAELDRHAAVERDRAEDLPEF